MLKDNLLKIFDEISAGNNLGEKITLVGATKFVSVDRINEAISLGLSHIGENKAQEFRDKFSFYLPSVKHFIGTLQENKLKYVVGKADFIDSVSSVALAEKIADAAKKLGVKQSVMVEISAGEEQNKSGATFEEAEEIVSAVIDREELCLSGIMSMLPETDDQGVAAALTRKTRDFYERVAAKIPSCRYLSVGMTSDYKTAIKNGSNMIRLGSAIFGARDETV